MSAKVTHWDWIQLTEAMATLPIAGALPCLKDTNLLIVGHPMLGVLLDGCLAEMEDFIPNGTAVISSCKKLSVKCKKRWATQVGPPTDEENSLNLAC